MIETDLIAKAAEQYAEQENSAWTNDYNGFVAGANYTLAVLQETSKNSSLETLVHLVKDVAFAETAKEDDLVRNYILNEIGNKLIECLELIEELKTKTQ